MEWDNSGLAFPMRAASRFPSFPPHRWVIGVAACVLGIGCALAADLGFSRSVTPGLTARLEARFGARAKPRLEGWSAFVRDAETRAKARPNAGDMEPLGGANAFFNRIPAVEDAVHWGQEDYWATPAETVASNGADCEDFAITKYFTLKELGVPVSRLRIVYVRSGASRSAHMVLAYYRSPQDDPLILDNLEGSIRPASDRPDLVPVYTFNDEDLVVVGQGQRVSPSSNRKWKDLLARLEAELRQ